MRGNSLLVGAAIALSPLGPAGAQVVAGQSQTEPAPTATAVVLPMGTPLVVVLDDTLTSAASQVGDHFKVVVAADVTDRGTVVIPKGTTGWGEVTFSTKTGAFGRAGLLGIALRVLDLNGKTVELDGRYREEGKDNGGAAGAVVFTAGIFGALVKGKTSVIPKGRELKARTGEDIAYTAAEPAVVTALPSAAPATSGIQPAAKTN